MRFFGKVLGVIGHQRGVVCNSTYINNTASYRHLCWMIVIKGHLVIIQGRIHNIVLIIHLGKSGASDNSIVFVIRIIIKFFHDAKSLVIPAFRVAHIDCSCHRYAFLELFYSQIIIGRVQV